MKYLSVLGSCYALVSLQMRESVATNDIFSLIWRYYGPKWIFWTIGEQLYIVYYPIISYGKIEVYRVETMDMGRSHWNNVVSETNIIYISTVVLIVRDKTLW